MVFSYKSVKIICRNWINTLGRISQLTTLSFRIVYATSCFRIEKHLVGNHSSFYIKTRGGGCAVWLRMGISFCAITEGPGFVLVVCSNQTLFVPDIEGPSVRTYLWGVSVGSSQLVGFVPERESVDWDTTDKDTKEKEGKRLPYQDIKTSKCNYLFHTQNIK